jgi:hypothetical protein
MKQPSKKLSEATRAKIEAVEKLNDFFEAIDAICADFKDKKDVAQHAEKLDQ